MVAKVHNDHCINIMAISPEGFPTGYTSVPLVQPGEIAPERHYCRWMDYQLGQAAKAHHDHCLGQAAKIEQLMNALSQHAPIGDGVEHSPGVLGHTSPAPFTYTAGGPGTDDADAEGLASAAAGSPESGEDGGNQQEPATE